MSIPSLRFKVWVCGGQKTISGEHVPRAPGSLLGVPPHEEFRFFEATPWRAFLKTILSYYGNTNVFVVPAWDCHRGARIEEGQVGRAAIQSGVSVTSKNSSLHHVPLHSIENLVNREFPGVTADEVVLGAQWSCSESGDTVTTIPVRALGAVLRLTGKTDEPDGYREIPPA